MMMAMLHSNGQRGMEKEKGFQIPSVQQKTTDDDDDDDDEMSLISLFNLSLVYIIIIAYVCMLGLCLASSAKILAILPSPCCRISCCWSPTQCEWWRPAAVPQFAISSGSASHLFRLNTFCTVELYALFNSARNLWSKEYTFTSLRDYNFGVSRYDGPYNLDPRDA